MNHNQHKFFTTAIVFVLMVASVIIAVQFDQVSHDVLNTAILMVNSFLLLILLSMHFHMRYKK